MTAMTATAPRCRDVIALRRADWLSKTCFSACVGRDFPAECKRVCEDLPWFNEGNQQPCMIIYFVDSSSSHCSKNSAMSSRAIVPLDEHLANQRLLSELDVEMTEASRGAEPKHLR